MPTLLTKSVRRLASTTVRDDGRNKPLVVTLYPNGDIGLRPKGTRREERYPLDAIYSIAVKARVLSERRNRTK